MQGEERYSIVGFGNKITAALNEVRPLLAPDSKLDLIVSQLPVVDARITRFVREFGIAILALILVTGAARFAPSINNRILQ